MKKINLIFTIVLILSSCSDFLDTENLTNKDSSNFPISSEDMDTELVSAYAANTEVWETSEKKCSPFLVSVEMADYTLSGGGTGDVTARAMSSNKQDVESMYSGTWNRLYRGIHRTNFLLENVEKVLWESESQKNEIIGQAYFLRANFYYDLGRMFENVPIHLSTEAENLPQATPQELYSQICSDLYQAVNLMPSTSYQDLNRNNLGRATKWAAEALLGRVYLFYSGVYKQEIVTLTDGTQLDKAKVLSVLEDCITNSGHALVKDFRNLWPYSYSNKDYKYAVDNNLQWIGEMGDNVETIFAYKFSNAGQIDQSYCNQPCLFFGLRGQQTMPFGKGWGWCTTNPKLYEEWSSDDLRKKGTILNVNDPDENVNYKWNANRCYNETGYFNKKYMPINLKNANGNLENYSVSLYGTSTNFQRNNTQDLVLIRFADVLLMAAELGSSQAQQYVDRIRQRAGLPSVPVTLAVIKKERLHEFAYEGLRFYDLMRWGDMETEINRMQKDVKVKTMGVEKTYNVTFRSETRGFLPIPECEIKLSEGILKQNEGWGTTEAFYQD